MGSGRQDFSLLSYDCWQPHFLKYGKDQTITGEDETTGEKEAETSRDEI